MKFWFSLLISALIITNFLAIYYLDDQIDRWFRFGSTLVLAGLYLFKYFSGYRLLLVFLLILVCDALLVYYEIPILKKIVYGSRILAYLFLINLVVQSLQRLKLNLVTILIAGFTIILDLYLLHEMAGLLREVDRDPVFFTLFYSLGIISLALAAVAISYLNRYSNKRGFLLVLVAFGFILSDIFYYNAYYLDFEIFFYLDRFCNICGLGALVLFSREAIRQPREEVLTPGQI